MNTNRTIIEHDRILGSVSFDSTEDADRPAQPKQEAGDANPSALPRLLRTLGAAILATASVTFLFQHWGTLDSISRYFAFLAFTGVLAGAGFLCGLRLREDKGARTFLGIAAAIVPIHFCALGGLIFSRVLAHRGISSHVSGVALWTAGTDSGALLTVVSGAAVLAAICYVAFAALFRKRAAELTLIYIASNAALLLPIRSHTFGLSLVIAALVLALARFDRRILTDTAAWTPEGRFVRLMLAAPAFMVIARTVVLYPITHGFISAILYLLAAATFFGVSRYSESRSTRVTGETLAVVPLLCGWYLTGIELLKHLDWSFAVISTLGAVLGAGLVAMDLLSAAGGHPKFRRIGTVIFSGSAVAGLFVFPSVWNSALCIAIGAMAAAYGCFFADRTAARTGVAATAIGVLYQLQAMARELVDYSPWLFLAVLGTVTVLLSSVLERNLFGLRARLAELRRSR